MPESLENRLPFTERRNLSFRGSCTVLKPLSLIAHGLRFLDFRRDMKSLSALTICQGVKVSIEFEVRPEKKGLE